MWDTNTLYQKDLVLLVFGFCLFPFFCLFFGFETDKDVTVIGGGSPALASRPRQDACGGTGSA